MARLDANIHHVGVFGRRTCGKTTVVKAMTRARWERERRYTIALDPNLETWHVGAVVTANREAWLATWRDPRARNCELVCEEAALTIARDSDLTDLFTRCGHAGHRLYVVGHTSASLLPVMREQLTELVLFRQSRREAEQWAELFCDPRIMQAMELDFARREFLHARLGGEVRRCVLKL